MKRDAEEIPLDALALPANDRVALAVCLLPSVDAHAEAGAEAAWASEIDRPSPNSMLEACKRFRGR